MQALKVRDDAALLHNSPPILGLVFRGFRGEEDYPAMSAVIEGSKSVDGLEWNQSVEDVARTYRHLVNCEASRDLLFAEIGGEVVGYGRVWWQQETQGTRLYQHFVHLLPQWRGKGIRRALLQYNECRLRQIAADHPDDGPRLLQGWASDTEDHWRNLLEQEGYSAVRYGFSMVRPDLEGIPDLPLPEVLEVRPVPPERVRSVWSAAREAFRDHWGYSDDEWSYEHWKAFQESPTYTPALWQVAWAGDEVAGMVLNYINEEENEEYGRQRGYTETICVRRPWRRQGVAKALIARSLQVLKARGMAEAALGVDAENPNGALQLYKSMGFRVVKEFTTYRKPMTQDSYPA